MLIHTAVCKTAAINCVVVGERFNSSSTHCQYASWDYMTNGKSGGVKAPLAGSIPVSNRKVGLSQLILTGNTATKLIW